MIIPESLGNIRILRIDSGKGNYLTPDDLQSMQGELRQAQLDSTVQAVVLTGTGQSFCAGMNLGSLDLKDSEGFANAFRMLDSLLFQAFTFDKPLVIWGNGHSIGAGLLLQSTADFVVLGNETRAKYSLPELKIGLTLDRLMCLLLEYYLTQKRMLEWVFDGENRSVADFTDVQNTCVVASDHALERALEIANRLIANCAGFSRFKIQQRAGVVEQMRAALQNHCYQVFVSLTVK